MHKYEKTAFLDGSIGFVPFGDNWCFCLTQGVNLTYGQGTRSGYLAEFFYIVTTRILGPVNIAAVAKL